MKVMMVVRLFTGLEESVRSGHWKPRGAPTIYKLIEALDRAGALSLWLTAKEVSQDASPRDQVRRLAGLASDVRLLAGEARFPAWLGRLRWYVAELRQIWLVWRGVRQLRPDVVYVDRGNLWIAGFLARFAGHPVTYRVMGFSDAMRDSVEGTGIRHRINRWLLRAPFAASVCTLDGSGGERMLDLCLHPDVPKHHLVNGVDWERFSAPAHEVPGGAPVRVLFAGRLDPIKGCHEFVSAFLIARSRNPGLLHAVVLGDGVLGSAMRQRVREAGADADVAFLGSVGHDQVGAAYRQADIYVTLNRMGSLSNTTLEALAAGCCVVLPTADPDTHRDEATDELLPADAAVRIPSVDDTGALADVLVELAGHADRRRKIAARGAAAARRFIPTWAERIEAEMRLLRRIAAHEPAGAVANLGGRRADDVRP